MKLTRSHGMFAAMCLIWGTTWIAMKMGIAVVPPCLFAGLRFTVAGAVVLGFWWWRGERLRIAVGDLGRFAAITLLMVTVAYALVFWAMRFVNTGITAILDMALMPIFLLALGVLFGEERFSRARAFGIVLGVAGLVVLFGPKIAAGGGAGGPMELAGCGAIAVSALAYSLGSVVSRPLLRVYPPVLVAGTTMFWGGVVLLAGSVAFEPGAVAALSLRWGAAAWAGWVFLVLFGSLAAYTIYLHLLKVWGGSRAGSYAFVSPIVAVLLGVVALGEQLRVSDLVGMGIMLAGARYVLREVPVAASVQAIKQAA